MTVTFSRASAVLWRAGDGWVLLTRADDDEVLRLSDAGAALWHALSEPRTAEGLVAALSQQYDAPEQTVTHDVTAMLHDLQSRGMVLTTPA